jgi:hypothetical protein
MKNIIFILKYIESLTSTAILLEFTFWNTKGQFHQHFCAFLFAKKIGHFFGKWQTPHRCDKFYVINLAPQFEAACW